MNKLPHRNDTIFAAVLHDGKLSIGTGTVHSAHINSFFAQVLLDEQIGPQPIKKNFTGTLETEGITWGYDGVDDRVQVLALAQMELDAAKAALALMRDA